MKLADMMMPTPPCMPATWTLRDAAAKMAELNLRVFPVLLEERIAGMITDWDLTIRGVALGKDPTTTKVEDVMAKDFWSLPGETDVQEAANLAREKRVRWIAVLDEKQKLSGLVYATQLAALNSSRVAKTQPLKTMPATKGATKPDLAANPTAS